MENKKERINKLKQELLISKTLNIKLNYSDLARKYKIDRRTIKKYNNGFEPKTKRNKISKLNDLKDKIQQKLQLPGATIKGVYEYLLEEYELGTYSNFHKYIVKNNLKPKRNKQPTLRFETDYGKQLQFDWKEDIQMVNKHGELFEFNIFSATLSASRLHVFIYSKYKTRNNVQCCLIDTFKYIGGVPQEILTDNMSSIVDIKNNRFYKEFISFTKNIGTVPKKCKPKHPFTKGKDESANRFMSWLIPYNHEFEDEKELIEIIKNINLKVNKQVNSTTGVAPILLYNKEKEYLKPLPNNEILQEYYVPTIKVKVSNESLFYYKGKKYSVPIKFIDHILDIQENDNKLYVYYNKDLITIHEISLKNINYKEEHYIEGLQKVLRNKEQTVIKEMAIENLEKLKGLN